MSEVKPMTIDYVKSQYKLIKKSTGDDEAAHSMEDDLHQEVLQEIANGAPNASELAKEALKTTGLSFSRWCA